MSTFKRGRKLVLEGLPGRPKTVAGVKGWDYKVGAMWSDAVYPAMDGTANSQPIAVPDGVEYVKVVTADEMLTDEALEEFVQAPAGPERE